MSPLTHIYLRGSSGHKKAPTLESFRGIKEKLTAFVSNNKAFWASLNLFIGHKNATAVGTEWQGTEGPQWTPTCQLLHVRYLSSQKSPALRLGIARMGDRWVFIALWTTYHITIHHLSETSHCGLIRLLKLIPQVIFQPFYAPMVTPVVVT